MTDHPRDHEDKFEYDPKTGKLSTNRPGVVQWAVSIKLVLKEIGFLVLALAAAYGLYTHGADITQIFSYLIKR